MGNGVEPPGKFSAGAGLTMKVPEKKKTTRSSRAGAYIKPLLVQCALCAIRAKQYPEVRNRHLALKKRCGNKKAIIAVALVLLTAIYNILKKNESYNPEPYRKADRPLTHREISADQAILILQRQGCLVTSPAWLICSNFGRHMPACFRVPFSG